MGTVIFWGTLAILIAFILGAFSNMLIDSRNTSAEGLFSFRSGNTTSCDICHMFYIRKPKIF